MPRKAKAMALFLTDETCSIRAVVRSRAAPAHHVERSGIIPHLADRRGASGSAAALGTDRPRVTRCARRVAAWGRWTQSATCHVREACRTLLKRRIQLAVRQEGDQHRDTAAIRPVGLWTELGGKEALLRARFEPKAESYERRAQ
jgi:hypothetical protein